MWIRENRPATVVVPKEIEQWIEVRPGEMALAVLAAAREAAAAALEPFRNAVAEGVSANLCDALTGLGQVSPSGLEVSVSWSRSRPVEGEVVSRIQLSPDYLPLLKEASRLFKETEPREEFHLRGYAVNLHRQPGERAGIVTVSGADEEAPRGVLVELGNAQYQEAVRAHVDGRVTASCTGSGTIDASSMNHHRHPRVRPTKWFLSSARTAVMRLWRASNGDTISNRPAAYARSRPRSSRSSWFPAQNHSR